MGEKFREGIKILFKAFVMRIYLKTTPNKEPVNFNYQPLLTGVLHKWLGENNIHGELALHSFSWLKEGKKVGNTLEFRNGATFFISFNNSDCIKQIVANILGDSALFHGMRVVDIMIGEDPDLSSRETFMLGSPVFIRRGIDGNDIHYSYEDKDVGRLLEETLRHKMKIAGLPDDDTLQIEFDLRYHDKKIKMINYRNIRNKTNWCPLIIRGKPETKLFAWNVGIGNSTGVGFGSIF